MEKQSIDSSKVLWSEAAKYGIVLGLFTCIFIFLDWGIAKIDVSEMRSIILVRVLSLILWFIKLVGCYYIMFRLVRQLRGRFDGVTRQHEISYGTMLAVTSGFICAAANYVNISYLNPDVIQTTMDALTSTMQMTDSELSTLRKTAQNIPIATFFVQWLYCIAYGAFISRFIARSESDDMFGNNQNDTTAEY